MKKAIRWTVYLLFLFCLPGLFSALLINEYIKSSTRNRILSAKSASAAKKYDCILVLGCGIKPDGTPTHMLEDRLLQAIQLYEQGASEKLLVSGDHGRADYDEVNVMKQFAVDRGIPSENVFMDHAGFSTYESLYRARDIFEAKRILIVTQEYHLYRALYVAQKLGLDAQGVAADLRPYEGQTYREMREILARDKDFLYAALQPKPTYLGDPIPVSGNGDITNDIKQTKE